MENNRPSDFNEYLGQEAVKRRLEIEIHAAKAQNRQLRHILINGPPGLGKTTLAKIIARKFSKGLVETTGPAIKSQETLIAKLKSLGAGGFLFIDEIHKISQDIQEYLLVVLEEGEIDEETKFNGGKMLCKRKLPPFTVIGATTKLSELDFAFRERFGIKETLEPYNISNLASIISRYMQKRGYDSIDEQALTAIAQRSRKTPRTALSLSEGIISFALFSNMQCITWALVQEYFKSVNKIDIHGLTETDHRFLKNLLYGPLSLKRWASKVGEKPAEIEEIYEPYYVQLNLIRIESRGRFANPKLFQIFGLKPPAWAFESEEDESNWKLGTKTVLEPELERAANSETIEFN